ncbi:MAG TPA: hypothetical protein VGR66_11345 [Candidatus Eisenbacteria bacterium]|jgi:hypothetical protein|nr:hypothetical protein [Candidatus Eisenbacteria bacterium]
MTPAAHDEWQGKLTYFDQPARPATVALVRYDHRQRVTRAVLILLACWAAAAVTVLIPILHLILVPAFFLAGPFFAYRRLHEVATVTRVRGACPACGQQIDHVAREPWKPLLRLDCEHCRRRVTLESELEGPRAAAPSA